MTTKAKRGRSDIHGGAKRTVRPPALPRPKDTQIYGSKNNAIFGYQSKELAESSKNYYEQRRRSPRNTSFQRSEQQRSVGQTLQPEIKNQGQFQPKPARRQALKQENGYIVPQSVTVNDTNQMQHATRSKKHFENDQSFQTWDKGAASLPHRSATNSICRCTYNKAGYLSNVRSVPAMSPPSFSKYSRKRFISRCNMLDLFLFFFGEPAIGLPAPLLLSL